MRRRMGGDAGGGGSAGAPAEGLGPGRGHWTAAGRSRSRREAAEAEADAPVFQYVGERATRADRIFVWGFSFSGALGAIFVLPGSGPQPRAGSRPRRRIQAVPYRLELDQKVRTAASSLLPRCRSLAFAIPPETFLEGWRRWVDKLREIDPPRRGGCCVRPASSRGHPVSRAGWLQGYGKEEGRLSEVKGPAHCLQLVGVRYLGFAPRARLQKFCCWES